MVHYYKFDLRYVTSLEWADVIIFEDNKLKQTELHATIILRKRDFLNN